MRHDKLLLSEADSNVHITGGHKFCYFRRRKGKDACVLALCWTLSICLLLLFTHRGNMQPLLPRGRESILPGCQHVLLGTSGDVKATGQDLLLRPHLFALILHILHNFYYILFRGKNHLRNSSSLSKELQTLAAEVTQRFY